MAWHDSRQLGCSEALAELGLQRVVPGACYSVDAGFDLKTRRRRRGSGAPQSLLVSAAQRDRSVRDAVTCSRVTTIPVVKVETRSTFRIAPARDQVPETPLRMAT